MLELSEATAEFDANRPSASWGVSELDPADELRLRLDLLKLRRDMGDSLGVANYDEEFGESLRTSGDPEIVTEYVALIDGMADQLEIARRDGRSPNMNWDHPFVRRLIADGLMARER